MFEGNSLSAMSHLRDVEQQFKRCTTGTYSSKPEPKPAPRFDPIPAQKLRNQIMLSTQNILSLDQGKLRPMNQSEDEFYAAFTPPPPLAKIAKGWHIRALASMLHLWRNHIPAR